MTPKFRLIAHADGGERVYSFEHPDHARQFGQLLETLGADWTLVGADGEVIA